MFPYQALVIDRMLGELRAESANDRLARAARRPSPKRGRRLPNLFGPTHLRLDDQAPFMPKLHDYPYPARG